MVDLGKGFEDMGPVPAAAAALASAQAPAANAPTVFQHPAGPVIERADPARWETIVPLDHPLMVDGELLERVICRRITGRQFMDLMMGVGDVSESELREAAYSLIAGIHRDVFNALAATDLEQVMDAIRPFLPHALRDDLDAAALLAGAATDGVG